MKRYTMLCATISFFIIMLVSTCNKTRNGLDCIEPPSILPLKSSNGANTFGCKINENNWTPFGVRWGFSFLEGPLKAKYFGHPTYYLLLNASRYIENKCDTIDQQFYIDLHNIKLGENKIDFRENVFSQWINNYHYTYSLDTTVSHVVKISKLDTINFIISGTFEFTLVGKTENDTLKITSGRFDVNARP